MEGYGASRSGRPALGITVAEIQDADTFADRLVGLVPTAVRLARVMGLSGDEAADAVQEAVALAWRHRQQLRGPLEPWFLAIVRRRAARVRRWLTVPAFWTTSPPSDWPSPDGMDPRLAAAVARLPRRQRAAIWLRYGLDMSTADVARVLGISEAAAKQLCLRGRVAVRARLLTEGPND